MTSQQPEARCPGPAPLRRLGARTALSLGAAALVLLISTGCGGRPSQPSIILITADTLRPDHLGIYGYHRDTSPNLDGFFERGAIFDQAFATQSNTTPSVVSMLSGLSPQEHGVRILFQLVPETLQLLPQHLPDSYETAAIVSNYVLTDEATGLARYFDHYDDFVAERADRSEVIYERRAEQTTDAVLSWLHSRATERPVFLWVHYIDPHGPYDPPEEWRNRFSHDGAVTMDESRIPGHMDQEDLLDGLEYVDRYDEEIAYLDFHVGRLLEGLDEHLQLSSALTLFVADHGESMMEHERWFAHGYHVYDEITRIPLLVRGPEFDGLGRISRPVSGKDVARSVLEFLGVEPKVEMSGIGLLRPSSDRVLYSEATRSDRQWRLAVQGDSRFLLRLDSGGAESERFRFDIATDPAQLHRLEWPTDSETSRALLDRVASDPDPAGSPGDAPMGRLLDAPKVDPRANPEALERLRALGYVDS